MNFEALLRGLRHRETEPTGAQSLHHYPFIVAAPIARARRIDTLSVKLCGRNDEVNGTARKVYCEEKSK